MTTGRQRRRIALAFGVEAGLLALALPLAWAAGVPLFGDLHWRAADLLLGLAATLPMFALPWWLMRSGLAPLRRLRELLEQRLLPYFHGWPAAALVGLSVVAGVSEEVLFRAVVQGGLAEWVGTPAALLAASVLFGVAHAVTPTYALLAALIGAWLGAVWLLAGNLLVPIVAHAAYDAALLLWMVRRR